MLKNINNLIDTLTKEIKVEPNSEAQKQEITQEKSLFEMGKAFLLGETLNNVVEDKKEIGLFENMPVGMQDKYEEMYLNKIKDSTKQREEQIAYRESLINEAQKEFNEKSKKEVEALEKEFKEKNQLNMQPKDLVKILFNKKITDKWEYTQYHGGNKDYYEKYKEQGQIVPMKTFVFNPKKPTVFNNDCNGLVKLFVDYSRKDKSVRDGLDSKEYREFADKNADGQSKFFEKQNEKLGNKPISLKEEGYKKMASQLESGMILYNPALKERKGLHGRGFDKGEVSHIAVVIENEKGEKFVAEMKGRSRGEHYELTKLETFLKQKASRDVATNISDWKAVSMFPDAKREYNKQLDQFVQNKLQDSNKEELAKRMEEINKIAPPLSDKEMEQHKNELAQLKRFEKEQGKEINYNDIQINMAERNSFEKEVVQDENYKSAYRSGFALS